MYHRWIIIALMLFSTASYGQELLVCKCETALAVDGEDWSKCILQEKEENIGCYSGWMTKIGRCNADDSSANINNDLCQERKRCLLNRQCEGSWGQWAINGYKCDCPTKKQVQSRYCYEHSQSTTLSYHCRGSNGNLEQKRKIPCSPRSCSKTSITFKSSTTTDEETTASKTSADTTQYDEGSTTARTRTRQEEAPTTVSLQTTIVAAAVGAVAVIAILLLFVVLLSRRKKQDDDENKNQPASNGIQPHLHDDTGFEGDVPNTIYIPYSDNGDSGHYNTFDHDSRTQTRKNGVARAATTRPPQNLLRPLPDPQRERSVTIGRPPPIGMYQDTRFSGSGLPLNEDSSGGAYEQPLLRGAESELYWSIDDTMDRLNTRT